MSEGNSVNEQISKIRDILERNKKIIEKEEDKKINESSQREDFSFINSIKIDNELKKKVILTFHDNNKDKKDEEKNILEAGKTIINQLLSEKTAAEATIKTAEVAKPRTMKSRFIDLFKGKPTEQTTEQTAEQKEIADLEQLKKTIEKQLPYYTELLNPPSSGGKHKRRRTKKSKHNKRKRTNRRRH